MNTNLNLRPSRVASWNAGLSLRHRMMAIYALSLSGWVTFSLGFWAALIWAYVERRKTRDPFMASHCSNVIQTFWISVALHLVGLCLAVLFIGGMVNLVVGLWTVYRMVKGLIYASKGWGCARPDVVLS